MKFNVVGKNITRWDALAKVTAKAKYTDDLIKEKMLYGKIVRATISHGWVKTIDYKEALKVTGVLKILTPDDVPNNLFTTAGHPHSVLPNAGDIKDHSILTRKIRMYGDEIAAVIAETEDAAEEAISLIKITYKELPFYLTAEEAMNKNAILIHENSPNNIIKETSTEIGDVEKGFKESTNIFEDTYKTQIVQHCQIENHVSYAYRDVDQRWVCVTSTQIPFIVKHILGEAFNLPASKFRVIKPFVGGGFGNKQDVILEPLVVAMSMAMNGLPVMIKLTREEVLAYTRVRHALTFKIKLGTDDNGLVKALQCRLISQGGAYASHGHSVTFVAEENLNIPYNIKNFKSLATTVYTNTAIGGAMRGYGAPQSAFALNSILDKAIRALKIDPIKFHLNNVIKKGDKAVYNSIVHHAVGLEDCLKKGYKLFNWEKRKKEKILIKNNNIKKGLGVAIFTYASNTRPFAPGVENSGCNLILNQDGRIKMLIGAAEIGQGSDTVLSQIAAEIIGVPYKWIIVDKHTDTDISPFDPGAFASRQTYVSGLAVKKAAEKLKNKIKKAVKLFYKEINIDMIDIVNGKIIYIKNNKHIINLEDLALKTHYDIEKGNTLTSSVSYVCLNNSYATCATFAEVDVDIRTGKTKIIDIMNVHDSGIIINPILAEGQVHGGMSMGIGYALSEELYYDKKTGKPLNNNLLDYKIPTFMDMPNLSCAFVELKDPFTAFGNKALGEPPVCGAAPAIRNAIIDATNIEINSLPMSSQKIFEALNNYKNK